MTDTKEAVGKSLFSECMDGWMNPFNLHQMTAAAGNCSESEKGGRHGKACALAENLWTQQMTFRIHAFSQEHKSAGAFLWRTGKSTGL